MSTTTLQKPDRITPGALIIRFFSGKFDALRYLPKLANGFLRFNSSGELVADDAPLNFITKSAAYTAKPGDRIALDTSGAPVTITLPATPSAGDTVKILDSAATFDSNNLTIGRNGSKINSASSNLVVAAENTLVTLVYIDSTIGWKAIYEAATAGTLAVSGTLDVAGVATLANTTEASSSTVGGTIISGGLAIAKKLYVGTAAVIGTTLNVVGIATLANATDASSSTVAGTVVTGGLAVAKKINVGTDAAVGGALTVTGAATLGATAITATTPSVTTSAGQTNTGFVKVNGKTSGSVKLTTADATAQDVTITIAAQTSGAGAIGIPDIAGVAQDLVLTAKAQTLTNKTLTAPVIGAATGTSVAVTAGLTSSGATGAGIGYATGAGGTVTQLTDATTAVTLNKLSGTITTVSLVLAAGVDTSFTLTNSTIAATDVVVASIKSYGGTADGIPVVDVVATAAGSCVLNIVNRGAVTLDAVAVINFAVIKAVAA